VDEFDLIDRLIAPLATAPGAQGLGNDGATIAPGPGCELVITKDMMAEDVHFLADDPPDLIARKLLRVNLSDLAAMGARPLGYLLGLSSDGRRDETWFRAFCKGLQQDQEQFDVSLLGGDTIASPKGVLTLSLTAFGEVPVGHSLSRSAVQPDDLVAVTGTIGDAALGLRAIRGELAELDESKRMFLSDRYRLPQPRTVLGPALVGLAHAALDVSDGLIADAGHLASRSRLAVNLDWTRIPLSDAGRTALNRDSGLKSVVLGGGDDYELLFTFAPANLDQVEAVAFECGVTVTVIGTCAIGAGAHVFAPDGQEIGLQEDGWRHKS